MIRRDSWLQFIHDIWEKVPIVWLSGVRRAGKTTLAQELENITYINCDLPSSHRKLQDPELFYDSLDTPIVVFDEIHQLDDPSRILKIGADAYSDIKILATGSSALSATSKFSDTLTGRKRSLHLHPVLASELDDFNVSDITHRLHRGGLPQVLLSDDYDYEFYAEWLDSYFARDIQELFRVEKRMGFLRLLEFLIMHNGGLVEYNTLAKYSGLSIPTVYNYLQVLEATHTVYGIRPFHGGGKRELVRQPKYYAFDTGFVAYCNGWKSLRPKDCGLLLENLTLDSLRTISSVSKIYFWRDKQQREVDFVLPRDDKNVDVIECKWNPDGFDPSHIEVFRTHYPYGNNYIVTSQKTEPYSNIVNDHRFTFVSIYDLPVYESIVR